MASDNAKDQKDRPMPPYEPETLFPDEIEGKDIIEHEITLEASASEDQFRPDRFGTDVDDDKYNQYSFGVGFDYWSDGKWKILPFCKPKHKDLKQELLQNNLPQHIGCRLNIEKYTTIYNKGETAYNKIAKILGQDGDKNTCHAHYFAYWNEYCSIKPNQFISLQHILSILFYTDTNELSMKLKNVCRKLSVTETVQDIEKRHSEYTNWLRLMAETIIFYGNRLSSKDSSIYHGLRKKFLFEEFKCKFSIPTSTSTDKQQARSFAKDNGIILEFGGIESVGDPYFDTAVLSDYPHEKEYLFFKAELNIRSIFIGDSKFSMDPLSLYQSIVNGSIIIDKTYLNKMAFRETQKKLNKYLKKLEDDQEETAQAEKSEAKQYGLEILKNFIKKNRIFYVNQQQIESKITNKKLRARFIQQNDDESFKDFSSKLLDAQNSGDIEIKKADYFVWTIKQKQIEKFVMKTNKYLRSPVMKSQDGTEYYCQLEWKERKSSNDDEIDDEKEGLDDKATTARLSLILWKSQTATKCISCDFFCQQMGKYYIRFHRQKLVLDKEDDTNPDSRITAAFSWDFIKEIDIEKDVEIIVSVRDETEINDKNNN